MDSNKPAKPPPPAKKPVGFRANLLVNNSSGVSPPVAPRKSPVGPGPVVPKKPPSLPLRPAVATIASSPKTTLQDGATSTAPTKVDSTPRPAPAPRPRPVPRRRVSLEKPPSQFGGGGSTSSLAVTPEGCSRSMSVDSNEDSDSMDMRIPAPDGSAVDYCLPLDVPTGTVCDNDHTKENVMRTAMDKNVNHEQKTSAVRQSTLSGQDSGFSKSNFQIVESQVSSDYSAQTLPKSLSMKFERKSEFAPCTLPKSQSQRFHGDKKPPVRDIADSMQELISVGLKHQLANKDRPKPPPKPKPNLKAKPILTPTTAASKDRSSPRSSFPQKCNRSLSYENAVNDPELANEGKIATCLTVVEPSTDETLETEDTPVKNVLRGVQVLPVVKSEVLAKSQEATEVSGPCLITKSETAEDSSISAEDHLNLAIKPHSGNVEVASSGTDGLISGGEILRKDSGRKQHAVFTAPPPPPVTELEKITFENSKMSQIPSVHEDDKIDELKPYRKAPPPPLPIKRSSTKKGKSSAQNDDSEQSTAMSLPSPPPMLVPRNRTTDSIGRSPAKFLDKSPSLFPGVQTASPSAVPPVLPPRKNPKYDSLGYLRPNPLGEMDSDYSYADVVNLDLHVPRSPMKSSAESLDVPVGTDASLDINRNESGGKERSDSILSDKRESMRSSLSSLGSNIYEFIRSRANSKDKRSSSIGSSVFYVDDGDHKDDLDIDIEVKVGGGARTPPQVEPQALTPPLPKGNDEALMDTVIPLPVAPPRARKNKSIDLGVITSTSTDDNILDEVVPSDDTYDETYMIGGATYEEPAGLRRARRHDSSDSDSDDYIYPGLQKPSSPHGKDDTPPPVPPRNKPMPPQPPLSQTILCELQSTPPLNPALVSPAVKQDYDYSGQMENEYNEPESPVSNGFENMYAEADEFRQTGGLNPPKMEEEEYADAEEVKDAVKTQFGSSSGDAAEVKEAIKKPSGTFELEYCDTEELKEEIKAQFGSSGDEIEYSDAEEIKSVVASAGNTEDVPLLADANITNVCSQGSQDESPAKQPANRSDKVTDKNPPLEEDIYESFSDEGSDAETPLNARKNSSSTLSIQSLESSPKSQRRALDTDKASPGRSLSYASSVDSVFLNMSLPNNHMDISEMTLDNDSLHSLSDDSDGDGVDIEDGQSGSPIEEKLARKRKKAFYIAQEVMTSEQSFVEVLKLLNQDYRAALTAASEADGSPVIPENILNSIFKYLPQLENFNRELLKDLQKRICNWEEDPRICDIFVKVGPFLKLYTSYIRGFENMQTSFDDARKRFPEFDKATKDFEMSKRCACLALKHYMLRPIQRIPQYRLLLLDYQKQLSEESSDYEDTKSALVIVSEVAEHANHSMKFGDDFKKLWDIQNNLIGQFEVIQPGREFIKEGILQKLSRKEMQPRMFFLLSDVLLYTTPVAAGYKLNNAIPVTGIRVNLPTKEDFQNEFSIMSTQRSFTVSASTAEERDDWLKTLNEVIDENQKKRCSFDVRKHSITSIDFKMEPDQNFKLGTRAPVWVPDARVSMCMLCTAEFTVTFRRHHCRACGKVVCGFCSDYRAPVRYLKYKAARVCANCFNILEREIDSVDLEPLEMPSTGERPNPFSRSSIKAKFKGLRAGGSFRKSLGKGKFKRPAVLQEITANSEHVEMSGYLKVWRGNKWKKRWFVLHGKALYTFRESEDAAAIESVVLLGFEVQTFTTPEDITDDNVMWFEGVEPNLVFELLHKGTNPFIFRTESPASRDKWINAMREATLP